MVEKELKLVVAENRHQAYVNRGFALIDEGVMKRIGIKQGDIIEITGPRSTGAIAMKGFPEDKGLEIIRMDGLIRHNAGTSIGEKVTVRKASLKEAKSVTIAPTDPRVRFMASGEVIRRNLLGRPLTKGDLIAPTPPEEPVRMGGLFGELFGDEFFGRMALPFGFGEIKFAVANTSPSGIVLVTDMTSVEVLPQAVEIKELRVPAVTYEDIGGLKEELQRVREMIELPLKHPEVFDRLGIEPPKGVLLHGPPGTGKTLIAKAVANESGANFTSIAGPEVMSKWYGESEARLREIFERAEKNAPSIVFIDELDAIAPKREEVTGEVERRVVATLCTALDGLKSRGKVIVIGASVTGETPILIKDESGTKIIPIGEFIDKFYAENEDGIEKQVDGIYTLGFDGFTSNNRFGQTYFKNSPFKRVRGVFRHKVNEIYEIEFIGGKIRATGDHSVFVRDRRGIYAKPVSELKVGECLVDIPFKANRTGPNPSLRSHSFQQNEDGTFEVFDPVVKDSYNAAQRGDISAEQLAAALGVWPSTVRRWSRGSNPRMFKTRLARSIPVRVEASSELMKLLGYYVAEGYSRHELDFCFGSHETDLINDVVVKMKNVFNVEPSKVRTVGARTNIIYHSKILADFFAKYCGKGARGKHVPNFIYESPREHFLAFLEAYVAGDGYELKRGKKGLEVTSVNKQLVLELNWLCRMHGIKSYVTKFTAKAGRRIGEQVIDKESNAYRLCIGETSNPFKTHSVAKMHIKRPVIKSIKKVHFDGYVYDLCGCENEAFFGGETPILLHNTNRVNALDPAIRRPGRFDREIELGVPDRDGRKEILQIHTRGMPLAKDVDLDRYANITHGFVGADLEALAKEAAMSALRRILPEIKLEENIIPPEVLEKLQVTKEDFDNALRMAEPSAMREVLIEIPDVHWEDVGGLERAKQELVEAVEWPIKYPDAFKRVGIEPPHGILLYGPPGTGKTLLARAVATESEANFISIKGPELLSKWVGESEKGVRETFRKAKMAAPAIIFFDEIDALVPRRGSGFGDAHVTERVISQLLTELDGLEKLENVVVIGATNRPDLVDPALLRPGRFDRLVLVPAPDEEARLEILKIHTKGMPLGKDVNLKLLAKETGGYSGSDIAALCREAAMLVLRKDIKGKEVRMQHFREAMEGIKPSLIPEMVKAYETFTERKSKRVAEEATGMHY